MLDFLLDVMSAIIITSVVLLFAMSLSFLPFVLPGSGNHANTAVNTVRPGSDSEHGGPSVQQEQGQKQEQEQRAIEQFYKEQQHRQTQLSEMTNEYQAQYLSDIDDAWKTENDQYRSGMITIPSADTGKFNPDLQGWTEDLRAGIPEDPDVIKETLQEPPESLDDSETPSAPVGACRIAPPEPSDDSETSPDDAPAPPLDNTAPPEL